MPFPTQPGRPYTRASVLALSEGQTGCYGIHNGKLWIYIGRGDIRSRLLDHLNGDNPCINQRGPTEYFSVLDPNPEPREKGLILEYAPVCNRKVG